MQSRLVKRILAFNFDINIVFIFATIGLFFLSSFTFRALMFSFMTYKFGQPLFLSWFIFFNLFVLGPFPLFVSLIVVSATPGQYLNGLREIDDSRRRRVDALQAFIHAYFLMPSVLIGLIPYSSAFLTYNRRTLIQWLAGTNTWMKGEKAPEHDDSPIPKYAGAASILVGVIFMFYLASVFLPANYSRKGIIIGGSLEQQKNALRDLKTSRKRNSTPELAVEGLRAALASKNAKALLEQLTARGQMYLTAKSRNLEIFSGLPEDLEFIRSEPVSNAKVKVIVYAVVAGKAVPKEEEIYFLKEFGEWKFDLFDYLKNPYSPNSTNQQ